MRMSVAGVIGALVVAATVVVATAVALASPPAAPASDPRAVEFFERKIRPLLAEHCFGCHGAGRRGSNLDLRSREAALRGGARGPAIVPGDPEASLVIRAVRYEGDLKMPPRGRLPAAALRDLEEWVRMGAPWGAAAPPPAPTAGGVSPEQRRFWAFQPVREPKVPRVRNARWPRSDIDRFILAELERRGLAPNGDADRRTLIRRATFDLIGLPPTPEEIDAFLADRSPDAFARVVDRLLASPHFGERWGRHWLDVARYADTNGQDENLIFGNAWRYRDYVIRAFNQDKPYDQFIREQLAGDLLPAASEQERYERLTATGFLVIGPKVLAEPDKPKLVMDVVDEQIDVTTRAFLGLTVSCARCHDHKFDPIPTRDYYALAGIFKSTVTIHSDQGIVSRWNERPLAPPEVVAARRRYEAQARELRERIARTQDANEKMRLAAELRALDAQAPPPLPMAMAVEEGKAQDCLVHLRGSTLNLGEVVPRRFLSIFYPGEPPPLQTRESGRRELAEWIASPDHPLTARVMVNRIWLHLMGRGLVDTPDNFGFLGERPSHPALLDYLARRFVEDGWSVKRLIRRIMLSRVYQMSTADQPAGRARDADNRWYWRANRRRLEVEAIRDAILAASGQLDRTMGRLGLEGQSGYATNDQSRDVARYDSHRRSVYLPVVRNAVYDMFQVFDFVDPSVVSARRATTTVAPQALFLMNSPFVIAQAGQMAERLMREAEGEGTRVQRAYLLTLGRPARPVEVVRTLEFLDRFAAELAAVEADPAARRRQAWAAVCQALFASNEFVYRD